MSVAGLVLGCAGLDLGSSGPRLVWVWSFLGMSWPGHALAFTCAVPCMGWAGHGVSWEWAVLGMVCDENSLGIAWARHGLHMGLVGHGLGKGWS
jgi:hypothetical protein